MGPRYETCLIHAWRPEFWSAAKIFGKSVDSCFKDQSLLQPRTILLMPNPIPLSHTLHLLFPYDFHKRKALISSDTMKYFTSRMGFGQFSLKVVNAFLDII